mmetsp:Transcript_167014/g.295740  ORF Transcript_167014/g.295740 Transcript_167014/m.295740 type:complete len:84 (-) Transcript_167014:40-291(-)
MPMWRGQQNADSVTNHNFKMKFKHKVVKIAMRHFLRKIWGKSVRKHVYVHKDIRSMNKETNVLVALTNIPKMVWHVLDGARRP